MTFFVDTWRGGTKRPSEVLRPILRCPPPTLPYPSARNPPSTCKKTNKYKQNHAFEEFLGRSPHSSVVEHPSSLPVLSSRFPPSCPVPPAPPMTKPTRSTEQKHGHLIYYMVYCTGCHETAQNHPSVFSALLILGQPNLSWLCRRSISLRDCQPLYRSVLSKDRLPTTSSHAASPRTLRLRPQGGEILVPSPGHFPPPCVPKADSRLPAATRKT